MRNIEYVKLFDLQVVVLVLWNTFECTCVFCLVISCVSGVKGLHADPQCLNSAHQAVTTVS